MSRRWTLPEGLPGGDLIPMMSARRRTELVDALFEASGGFQRALAWIDKSDDNYGEFFIKVWAKGAIRPTQIEDHRASDIEELLARLDAGEHAKVVNPEPVRETESA